MAAPPDGYLELAVKLVALEERMKTMQAVQ